MTREIVDNILFHIYVYQSEIHHRPVDLPEVVEGRIYIFGPIRRPPPCLLQFMPFPCRVGETPDQQFLSGTGAGRSYMTMMPVVVFSIPFSRARRTAWI